MHAYTYVMCTKQTIDNSVMFTPTISGGRGTPSTTPSTRTQTTPTNTLSRATPRTPTTPTPATTPRGNTSGMPPATNGTNGPSTDHVDMQSDGR